jgi:hypothetical protein
VASLARENEPEENKDFFADAPLPEESDGGPEFEDIEKDSFSVPDGYSLESILAEYKGTAYIAGDKRTPPAVLQEKTDKIVMEVAGGKTGQIPKVPEASLQKSDVTGSTIVLPSIDEITIAPDRAPRTGTNDSVFGNNDASKGTDTQVIRFQKYRDVTESGPDSRQSDIVREVNSAIDQQTQLEEDSKKSVRKVFGIFNRNIKTNEDELFDDEEEVPEAPVPVIEEEVYEEPDYREATKRFAERCNSYSIRSFASLVITVVMAILTLVFESDAQLPFGMGQNKILFAGILLILLFVVMMLNIGKLLSGITDFFGRGPNIESLNLFSCLATIAAAAYGIYKQDTAVGMPYCVISAFSLTFTLWAEKVYYRALTETMKTAQAAARPSGVIAEMCGELDSTIVKKVTGRTAGFYNNLIQADISEIAYKFASPVLIVISLILALYASVGHGRAQYFLQYFAAIMAAAAPFSAVFAYAIPLSAVSRRARQSGAAIAGWGGADDLFHTDGVSITDEDLFPAGTVSIAGIKVFEEMQPEKATRYTGSLIIASNSVLAKLFSDQMNKQAMNLMRVEDFACYEGGIGGVIKGERVITGSAAFMNLMGIRVPSSLNMKNAIFTAINKKLIAVFAVNYVPIKSVQNALISIIRYRVKLFFAVRDFNITPVMLEQKFKVPVNDVEYLPIQNTYELSDNNKQDAKRVSAILIREGMGPYIESITGGRRLRTTALIATIFSILSACAGMLIMFTICWAGSFTAARAGNLLLYMLSMLFVTVIICGFSKYRQ